MKPALRHILIAVLVCCANPTHAQEEFQIIEQWECFDFFEYTRQYNRTALVKLTRRRLRITNSDFLDFGEVESLGDTHGAEFTVQGINRRWDFGPDFGRKGYKYAFIITPKKIGLYYDFTDFTSQDRVKPSQFFKCEKK